MKKNKSKARQQYATGIRSMVRKGNGDTNLKRMKHSFFMTALFDKRVQTEMSKLPLEQRQEYKDLAMKVFKDALLPATEEGVAEAKLDFNELVNPPSGSSSESVS